MRHKAKRQSKFETKEIDELPENWPTEILFLEDQTYSSAVTADLRIALSRSTPESASYMKVTPEALKTPCARAEIRTIDDAKHPAYGQRGLFAAHHLEPGTFV